MITSGQMDVIRFEWGEDHVEKIVQEFDMDDNPVEKGHGLEETYVEDRWKCDCNKVYDSLEEAIDCCIPYYKVFDSMDND